MTEKLGDLDPVLWHRRDTEAVRSDLFAYYQMVKPRLSWFGHSQIDNFVPSITANANCFTYATGIDITGNCSFGPEYFPFVSLAEKKSTETIVSIDHNMLNFLYSPAIFETRMKMGGFKTINDCHPKEMRALIPIIGMRHFSGYHFIKPQVAFSNQGPRITLSHMFFGEKPSAPQDPKTFFVDHGGRFESYFPPKLFLFQGNLQRRDLKVDESPEKRLVQIAWNAKL